MPDYIPMKFSSPTTPPSPLSVEFSLVVEDKHQATSENNEIVSINPECPAFLQQTAENTRDNLFLRLINHPLASLGPETVSGFQYFLSGRGDTVGAVEGVSGNGIAKPLSVSWLENEKKAQQFEIVQSTLVKRIQKDLTNLLKTMKMGETKTLSVPNPNQYVTAIKAPPGLNLQPRTVDFANRVGEATLELLPHLTVKKNSKLVPDTVSGQITIKLH